MTDSTTSATTTVRAPMTTVGAAGLLGDEARGGNDTGGPAREIRTAASAAGNDIGRCLEFAHRWGDRLPLPGTGRTRQRWRLLAAAAAGDLTAARVLEPHADALAILAEAHRPAAPGTWGVFAAEGPGTALDAAQGSTGWLLTGTKPWCSLGDRLDHALVTAHVGDGRRLFAVDLRHPGVRATRDARWVSRGLAAVPSGPLDFDGVPAEPIAAPGWYLTRPGFHWGGMGVAACWFGGATAVVATMRHELAQRSRSQVRSLHVGTADVALFAAGCCLHEAATAVDESGAGAESDAGVGAGALVAGRVRTAVHDACETVLREAAHALGPAPLAFDETFARRVADLAMYLRQHHGERDVADLGARLLDSEQSP